MLLSADGPLRRLRVMVGELAGYQESGPGSIPGQHLPCMPAFVICPAIFGQMRDGHQCHVPHLACYIPVSPVTLQQSGNMFESFLLHSCLQSIKPEHVQLKRVCCPLVILGC